jgi:L-lactate dehydrogenase complex protein LldG
MSAREDILSAIRARRFTSAKRPAPYAAPVQASDLVGHFTARAQSADASVRVLTSAAEIPSAISDILRDRNLPAIVHLAPDSPLADLEWNRAPGLIVERSAPGPNDAALAGADYAIAETGTLAYLAEKGAPASWHFRPGLEIAVVKADAILPHLENLLARARSALPHTVNLVTGPSRTGDIEQTLELGAHGPKELVVLIVRV